MLPAFEGFALGGGLIVAIGAQNAYILKQGLKREHVFVLCALCALADAVLIAAGVAGFGAVVAATPWLTALAAWGGAAFLGWYGARSFRAALHPGRMDTAGGGGATPLKTAVLTVLAFTFLNPHVYLDTVVLVGGLAGQHPPAQRLAFGVGAVLASVVWFFGLGYGARLLAPLFRRPATWRALDLAIGVVMWTIAGSLVWGRV
ncbi:MAG: amino acid transporter [Rhodobacterales bacterium]|nr:amino acid transporter [Rhodobacterales bacterium]